MARRGSIRVWTIGIALAAVFTIVVDFAAIGTRSNASVAIELVGPERILLPADPDASAQPTNPSESSVAPDDDTTTQDPLAAEAPVIAPAPHNPSDDSPAPALGRTVMLDITRAPSALGPGPVFGYTPSDGDDATHVVAGLGGARLWRAPLDGMSPVTIGGAAVGYAYTHDGDWFRALSTSAAGTTIVSNLAAGGAIWEWTDASGTQFVNHYDLGREVPGAFFVRASDGRQLNPPQAGGRFARPPPAGAPPPPAP